MSRGRRKRRTSLGEIAYRISMSLSKRPETHKQDWDGERGSALLCSSLLCSLVHTVSPPWVLKEPCATTRVLFLSTTSSIQAPSQTAYRYYTLFPHPRIRLSWVTWGQGEELDLGLVPNLDLDLIHPGSHPGFEIYKRWASPASVNTDQLILLLYGVLRSTFAPLLLSICNVYKYMSNMVKY